MNLVHKWKLKDTIVVDIFFVIYLIGVITLLFIKSLFFLAIFLILYVITNSLLAVICHECPYQGQFCPGISQLLFGPLFSNLIIKKGKEISNKNLKIILVLYGLIGLGNFISILIVLFFLYFQDELLIVVIFVAISFIVYSTIAWPIFCPKCINKDKCLVKNCKKFFLEN